ncbi:ferric reductase-like transmembrane domain-containing protein [Pelagicoccus sp. SDUM812003]|uniref:sulfite oxidase heme-binding subunit YedZ n=1 Tax=Pelagicoccus sp. SDUM812003 TaxID=3041267 RepID=UPI00280DFF1D|nr:ferric reductase-like transmembrane domain-containing protein [Pelagicoccus sp. SDUM812003]MDQ8202213.1 ferric reductase-like transmembrane domain-containing protein [Pelagicoccus sp. SDUM812003]
MKRQARILRSGWLLYAALCLPLVVVFIQAGQGNVEYLADPAKFLLEFMGKAAVVFLVVTMAVTPLRQLFPKSDLFKALAFRRRQLGIAVFVYALLHLLLYVPYIGSWEAFADEWSKLFILSGLVALALLLVLALTSNNWSVRKLGGKGWKRLHKLTYVAAALVIYHQVAQEKTGYRETLVYFGPLLALEAVRLGRWWKNRIPSVQSPSRETG